VGGAHRTSARGCRRLGGILKSIPIDFSGARIELAVTCSEDVTDYVGRGCASTAKAGNLAFDTIQASGEGNHCGRSTPSRCPQPDGRSVFGVCVAGTRKLWADDLQLLVYAKPVSAAPKVQRPKTVVDTDQEFDAGSKISFASLTPIQVENIVTLGKLWGFLKYHHPAVTSRRNIGTTNCSASCPLLRARSRRPIALVNWIGLRGDRRLRPARP
jgi:hypothetical protein